TPPSFRGRLPTVGRGHGRPERPPGRFDGSGPFSGPGPPGGSGLSGVPGLSGDSAVCPASHRKVESIGNNFGTVPVVPCERLSGWHSRTLDGTEVVRQT